MVAMASAIGKAFTTTIAFLTATATHIQPTIKKSVKRYMLAGVIAMQATARTVAAAKSEFFLPLHSPIIKRSRIATGIPSEQNIDLPCHVRDKINVESVRYEWKSQIVKRETNDAKRLLYFALSFSNKSIEIL